MCEWGGWAGGETLQAPKSDLSRKEYCGEQTIARKAAKNLTPATIIHPWGRLRMSLDFLAALFIMYDCFMIPMILGFEQYEEPRPLSVLTLVFWTFAMFF